MKAVILAGGRGTRLAPYTTVFPKPMVPIGQRPILEIILRQLINAGFDEAILSVGYLAELIRAYFQNAHHRLPGLSLSYVSEEEPMGTAGSIRQIEGLDTTFLVMNGDVLTSLDYGELIRSHREKGGALTVAVHRRRVKIDFGVIETDAQGNIVGYVEKPETEHLVSMGVYVYEPRVLDYIEPNTHLDFPDLVLRLLENGEKVVGYPYEGYWLDIGRHDDYAKAQEEANVIWKQLLPGDEM